MSSNKHLHVDKLDTMLHEKLRITVSGLEPAANYKLLLVLDHMYGQHKAFAIFKADFSGCIDLTRDRPIRGSYHDVDSMGLFLSMLAQPSFEFGGYLRCTPPVPFYYDLELYDSSNNLMESVVIKKHWMHPRLQRTEIEDYGFCGTEYKPPGDGPFPTIIDISGTGGGLHEHKGAMLASQGYVVLCVAYFQYKNLPCKLEDVDIEYFKNPVRYLMSRSYVRKDCGLGLQGVSLGGTLCDYLPQRHSEIKSVVSINGAYGLSEYLKMKENGKNMKLMELDDQRYFVINDIVCSGKCLQTSVEFAKPETDIEWDRIEKDVKYRLITAVDDICAAPVAANNRRFHKLKEHGIHVEIEYCNGGHIVEPPYFPHHEIVYTYSAVRYSYNGYGGEVTLHGKSQEITWARTLEFFARTLAKPVPMPDWNRLTRIIKPTRDQQKVLIKSLTKVPCRI